MVAVLGMVEGMYLGRVEGMYVLVAVFGWGRGWNINKTRRLGVATWWRSSAVDRCWSVFPATGRPDGELHALQDAPRTAEVLHLMLLQEALQRQVV